MASGALRVVGELGNLEHLLVDATVEQLQLALFDYQVRNEGPIRIALDQEVIRIDRMQLAGEDTALDLTGEIGLRDDEIALRATGDVNLEFYKASSETSEAPVMPKSSPRFADRCVRRCCQGSPRSPAGGSGTSRCRTRSKPRTVESFSMPRAFTWTI